MRRFRLQRDEDSGSLAVTRVIGEGVEFADGSCALRWLTAAAGTSAYARVADIVTNYCHDSRTRLIWLDGTAQNRQSDPLRASDDSREHLLGRRRAEVIARLQGG